MNTIQSVIELSWGRLGMIRTVLATLLVLSSLVSSASAQSCSVPNTLTNGTNADATQVMANFAAILSCLNSPAAASAPRGYLSGLTLSAAGGSASFGIAAGLATSDDVTTSMKLSAAYGKTTSAWAVGSGNGSLDTGSVANNTWYHVFLVERIDTGVVDVLISLSATTPTLPTNYTKQRRIGSMKTDGSAQWVKFSQLGDEFMWAVPTQDSTSAIGTSASSITLNAPTGVQVAARIAGLYVSTTLNSTVLFSPLDTTDTASTFTTFNGMVIAASTNSPYTLDIRTSTSAQIRIRASVASTTVWVNTFGWIDRRGRDQ
jgi:hypothetical protein